MSFSAHPEFVSHGYIPKVFQWVLPRHLGNKIGIHTMAYIGNKTWIHSDPVAEEVIESIEPEDYDDWDTFEVNIWRWNVLKDN